MTAAEAEETIAGLRAEIARLELAAEAARVEQRRLAVELGHRVKNTLSAVKALAGQTFRADTPLDAALGVFDERIVGLARANDAILAESWTTVTLERVVRSVLLPQGTPQGPLTIGGGALRVGAGAALSIAMALHELATNAKRFGAWSVPGGSVDLGWRVPDDPQALFTLTWAETGGPDAAQPGARGFGLRLAEQSLRSAFGRDVSFAFQPGGLVCRVRAQLADIAAPTG